LPAEIHPALTQLHCLFTNDRGLRGRNEGFSSRYGWKRIVLIGWFAAIVGVATTPAQQKPTVRRNVQLTIDGSHIINRNTSSAQASSVFLLIVEHPNTLIRLDANLAWKMLPRTVLRFQCSEVAVFPSGSDEEPWTVGKHCRLANAPSPGMY